MSEAKSYANIRDALTDPETASHFSCMLEIGVTRFHESAFAIYELGAHAVSHLVMPEFDTEDLMSAVETGSHEQVDIDQLVIIEGVSSLDVEESILKGLQYDDLSDFSDIAIQAVGNIKKSADYVEDEKPRLIRNILERDLKQRGMKTERFRTDIAFLFHNHPQYPTKTVSVERLLFPSEADMDFVARISEDSPGFIDGILASDHSRKNGRLLLLAPFSDINPETYAYREDLFLTRDEITKVLGRVGYASIVLDLKKNGKLAANQMKRLKTFVADIR